ncbi:tRNA epoxyqueuosine(34) reductase QueG [Pedomonas sp.]|uniref:tRNA epoxyqueuosine(34) reductase QueG n=1 Tax=Pedomonas sp. TaxID=2976421 RepID=UPI0039C9C5A4
MTSDLTASLKAEAIAAGFSAIGIAPADACPEASARLRQFVAEGRHGDMLWMEERLHHRESPQGLWPEVRSVIMLGTSYAPRLDPLRHAENPDIGVVSVYAQGSDYHDLIKRRLKQVARWFVERTAKLGTQADVKVFVDTAPVMEKPLARAAGLGWQGKHTNLVSREHGSWLFLGAIYTTAELEYDQPHADRCGRCTACQTACPTQAFPAPYQLDARRCISYLTIENKGLIPTEFRKAIGNRIYGCDDCLAVCPWNKFAEAAQELAFAPRAELTAPALADLLQLDDAAFRQVFSGSPIKRVGRNRFVRNALVAAGNSAAPALLRQIRPLLDDPEPVVRATAVWAFRQLAAAPDITQEREKRLPTETDPDVAREWVA